MQNPVSFYRAVPIMIYAKSKNKGGGNLLTLCSEGRNEVEGKLRFL